MPDQAIRHYVGVDVAKRTLDYSLTDTDQGQVPNSAEGRAELLSKLKTLPHVCVVCEASGGYERALLADLHRAGLEVCLVQPGRVRAFAYAEGLLAKTDPIDARLLRRFGQKIEPPLYVAPQPGSMLLRELLEYRLMLVAQLQEVRARQEVAGQTLAGLLQPHEKQLLSSLAAIEQRIQEHVHADEQLRAKQQRLCQLQGCGPVLSTTLLAYVPELGRITNKSLSALIGLAPHPRQTGDTERPRHVRGGRKLVRNVLYMAAMSAVRFNPVLRDFYLRLIHRPRNPRLKIVALVAVMRKMLCLLNRLIADPAFSLVS